MDTNLVLPLTSRKCRVIFDYFLEGPLQVNILPLLLFLASNHYYPHEIAIKAGRFICPNLGRIVKMTNLSRILKNAIN